MESCAAVPAEPAPVVPDEGRAIAPIATDKSRRPADTRSGTLAAAAAIVAHTKAQPRDPRAGPGTPTGRAQNSEMPRWQDRTHNILCNSRKTVSRGPARHEIEFLKLSSFVPRTRLERKSNARGSHNKCISHVRLFHN